MEIELSIVKNLVTSSLLEQRDIPCICRIAREFEIDFVSPLPEAHGVVGNWDLTKINERAPAGAGGKYIHYCFGKLSLARTEGDKYQIIELSFFNRAVGWCPIIIDGEYGPVGSFWDEEE